MNFNDDYERIALSKQDLRHVYIQILNQTTSKLDLHLPTSDNDPLKNKVANALDDFLMGCFELAKSSLVIDGLDMSDKSNSRNSISEMLSLKPREKVEDFDVSVNAKLREILLKVEEQTMELTEMRRELPKQASETYDNLVSKVDNEVSLLIRDIDSQTSQKEEQEEQEEHLEKIPDFSQVSLDYREHLSILQNLKNTIPAKQVELDRINDTIQFLESAYNQQAKE